LGDQPKGEGRRGEIKRLKKILEGEGWNEECLQRIEKKGKKRRKLYDLVVME